MDGLLIDSESVFTDIINEILSRYGVAERLSSDVKAKITGIPQSETIKILIDHYKLPLTPTELMGIMEPLQRAMFAHVQPMPGAINLVTSLVKNGVPIAIATSTRAAIYPYKTSHLPHLFSPFPVQAVIKGDDPRVHRGKPSPDIFFEAAKALNLTRPEELARCIVFEDGVPGVIGAKKAGMQVVWVPNPEVKKAVKEEDLACTQDVEVLESLNEWSPRRNRFDWDIEEMEV
ncbi:HAD-like protein [Atractiella rhizophila]|nr:HAD-like protein [Atractiella rhizophila]